MIGNNLMGVLDLVKIFQGGSWEQKKKVFTGGVGLGV